MFRSSALLAASRRLSRASVFPRVINRGQDHQRQRRRGNQAADDDGGQRALHVAANRKSAERGGQKPEVADGSGHQHGAQSLGAPRDGPTLRGRIIARQRLRFATMITPFCTATPKRAMKPTALETFRVMSRRRKRRQTPDQGQRNRQQNDCGEPPLAKAANSIRKITPNAPGTINASRACARRWFSNWPPQPIS